MRIRLCTLLLLLAATAVPACAEDLVLRNVNIVDVDSGSIVAGRSVVVSDGHIKAIGPQESVRAPAAARVIDGSGRYLMPALWDMHTHPTEPEALSMLVANGVGGTRIMWGLPRHLEWRARVELGELLGPRLLIAGPIIEGVPPAQAASVVDTEGRRLVKTFAEGVAEVRRQQAAGFDYIKVYNNIPLDAYNGLVAEADRLRMPVVGHVPFAAGIQGALAARQKSIEHLRGYIEKLVPADAPIQPGIDMRSRALAWQYADLSRIPELVRATRDAGAWQCPTLGTSIYTAPGSAIERYLATPEAEYLDPQTREAFRHRGRVKWLSNFTEADFERATHANDKQAVLLRAMHAAGVPLLAGTDSNSFGFSLHRELEALVAVGLRPGEALQTATINPARFAGLEKEVGRVATGYAADLILLDANPLQDIRNTSRINAVILRGQLLDRAALDAMLAKLRLRTDTKR
jgi:imidazolonepropionase-like amidohydrolase